MKDTHPLSSTLSLSPYRSIAVSLPRPRADLLSPLWPITGAQCVAETGRKHREGEPHNGAAAHYLRARTSHCDARNTNRVAHTADELTLVPRWTQTFLKMVER